MDNKDRRSVRDSVTQSAAPLPRPRYTFVESDMYSLNTNHSRDSDFSFLQPEEGEMYDEHDDHESTNEQANIFQPPVPPISSHRRGSNTSSARAPSAASSTGPAQALYQNHAANSSQQTWASSYHTTKGSNGMGGGLNPINSASLHNGSSTIVAEEGTVPAHQAIKATTPFDDHLDPAPIPPPVKPYSGTGFNEKSLASDGQIDGTGMPDNGSPDGNGASGKRGKKKLWIFIGIVALIAILAAVLIPIGLLVIGKNNKDTSRTQQSPSSTSGPSSTSTATSDNSIPSSAKGTILDPSTWLDKTDFNTTYTNATVGGLSIMGLNSTWDDSAQANPHVPPLNEPFPYGELPIRGVNLGGWLVTEPFITPSFFSNTSNPPIVDEWTLVGSLNASGGMANVKQTLETHYATWVNETTLQEIAAAGLDHVRIPYGYWAVKTYPGDQYLPQVSWRYLLRAIEWCRKYGLRVSLDFHAAPGSQNGWNHSGRQGYPHWLNGTQGLVYGNQSLELHDQLSKFFSQDRYKNIITFYGLVNEPKMQTLNNTLVIDWTSQAYDIVRNNSYTGNIVFGDGFLGAGAWKGQFPPSAYPNMTLDIHQYTIFDTYLIGLSHEAKLNLVCNQWATTMNLSSNEMTGHGPTLIGEWSQADNDCTLNLNNVGVGSRWEGNFNPGYSTPPVFTPSCDGAINCTCSPSNTNPDNYSDAYKEYLLQFAEVQMEVFESNGGWGSIYWTWDTELVESSQWSYKKGIEYGIMPKVAYQRTYNCSSQVPDYVALGLPENY
ncbi:Exg2p [Sugiyamaella lignohabitans]|uniref:glucan 1,3-beta-glucosidase n=1 Tax=Sugiyamaella lignohabitans TaxID=796027 RepID=A0A167EM88_9ASCO|nr:Exg2p [Sugiyamaella lignohabitans]ANB14244.1 Exg2p [Sugiyamaella lignohabitans]